MHSPVSVITRCKSLLHSRQHGRSSHCTSVAMKPYRETREISAEQKKKKERKKSRTSEENILATRRRGGGWARGMSGLQLSNAEQMTVAVRIKYSPHSRPNTEPCPAVIQQTKPGSRHFGVPSLTSASISSLLRRSLFLRCHPPLLTSLLHVRACCLCCLQSKPSPNVFSLNHRGLENVGLKLNVRKTRLLQSFEIINTPEARRKCL